MRPALAIPLILLAAGAFAADKPEAAPGPLAATVLARIADSEENACVAVALVEETTRFAFGCSKDAGAATPGRDAIFEIGSISKAFTGILLADMVLKGEVSLDDPASRYSRPGAKLPTRNGKEITLRDLATQTAGLPRLPPGFRPADPSNPYADFDANALYAALERTELGVDIGTRYLYSNFGFMWLSEILGRAGGGTFEEVLRRRVLVPLGMNDTAVALGEAQGRRFIEGHDQARRAVPHWDIPPQLAGVGGLRSTIGDMAKLAEAIAGRRDTPLKEAIELAMKPQRPAGGSLEIGLAWHVQALPDGRRVAWHNGGTAGFRSMIAADRAARRAAVVLVDAESSFDDLAIHLVDDNYAMKKKRTAIALDGRAREEYAGRYRVSPTFSIAFYVQGDKLMTQGTGQPAIEVFAEAKDRFFLRVVDAQVEFHRDAEGRVTGMTLFQNGRKVEAPRVSDKP